MTTQVADYRFTSHGWKDHGPAQRARVHTYKGAYVSLTSLCNTDVCTYCYARDQKADTHTMPLSRFIEILDMLGEISDFPEVYLVGGEPSIVPNLPEYLDEIARRGWTTTIYTNGGFNEKRRDALIASPAVKRLSFHYDELLFSKFAWLRPRWEQNLRILSETKEVSIIGVIEGDDFPYFELVELAADHGASYTWIFAAPTSGGTPFLGLHEMRALGPQVQRMLLRALELNVKCSPDLPVPLCIFERDFLDRYAETFALIRRCAPFAYFHVDGRISSCTAMPIHTAPKPGSGDELAEIIERHRELDRMLKQRPSFPECVTCEMHLKQICQGGCMTYKVYQEKTRSNAVPVSILPSAPAGHQT